MVSGYPDKLNRQFYIHLWFLQSLDFGFGRLVLDSNFVISVLQRSEKGFQRLVNVEAGLDSMATSFEGRLAKFRWFGNFILAVLGFRGVPLVLYSSSLCDDISACLLFVTGFASFRILVTLQNV